MNYNASYNTGATFYPGGEDSYYMPEIVQPSPHRVNDHPTNMPQNVAHMEQAAQGREPRSSALVNGSPNQYNNGWSYPPAAPQRIDTYGSSNYGSTPNTPQNQQPPPSPTNQTYQSHPQYSTGLSEQPNFSPFPPLRNPPPNIPPTDEQKENTLEAARQPVLSCNDPETQLTWAQDVLQYVEVAQHNEQRLAVTQGARSRTPRVEHQLREDAMKIVNFLADQHHPKAEFIRGTWLEFGKFGERVDKKEAFHSYTRAADKGYARAQYRIGMQFESSNDALKAIKYYQRGADAGDSASCYRLGMMTLLGQHGQQQDYERGINLIYSAAEAADENAPQGAYVYGMLKAGELPQITVPDRFLRRDVIAAKTNIEKAAYLGFSKAQVRMGTAYELGELGCPFDPALSLHYNALAARQGEPEAEMAISKWFLCGHEGLFEKNEEMAFTYAQRAAVGGLATAQFAMGYFYEVGIYVPTDFKEAREWYTKAAESGNPDAAGRVDAIKRSKTLSRRDHENVALSKIRQTHGAAQQNPPPVPPAQHPMSPSLEMPDPSRLNLNPSYGQPQSAPYPTGDPNFRPGSAFGVNPNLRTNSSSPRPGGPLSSQYPPQQQRPYQGYGQMPGAYSGARPPSAPPQGQQYQARPPSRPGTTSPYLQPQGSGHNTPPVPPLPSKIDIGFSAPNDPTGADRRHRPQNPYNGPRPTHPSAQPPRTSSRPNQPMPSNQRPSGGSSAPQPRPPAQQRPQQRPAKQQAPAPAGPQRKPTKVSASTARPPGKGPATFEEMGIPNKKDKSDCSVM